MASRGRSLGHFLIVILTVALLLLTILSAEVSGIDYEFAPPQNDSLTPKQSTDRCSCAFTSEDSTSIDPQSNNAGGYWSLILGILACVSLEMLALVGGTIGDFLIATIITAVLFYFDRTLTLIAYLFSIFIVVVCLFSMIEVWLEGMQLDIAKYTNMSSSSTPPSSPAPTRKQVVSRKRSAKNNGNANPGMNGMQMGMLLRVALEPSKKTGQVRG